MSITLNHCSLRTVDEVQRTIALAKANDIHFGETHIRGCLVLDSSISSDLAELAARMQQGALHLKPLEPSDDSILDVTTHQRMLEDAIDIFGQDKISRVYGGPNTDLASLVRYWIEQHDLLDRFEFVGATTRLPTVSEMDELRALAIPFRDRYLHKEALLAWIYVDSTYCTTSISLLGTDKRSQCNTPRNG